MWCDPGMIRRMDRWQQRGVGGRAPEVLAADEGIVIRCASPLPRLLELALDNL